MKAYETYVGNNEEYTDVDNPYFKHIQEIGSEFGATTGRSRKVNWLNMERIVQAINVNAVTYLIINKADVLEDVGIFGAIDLGGNLVTYTELNDFTSFVKNTISDNVDNMPHITWSFSPSSV
jgi:adenylosuccinate synthase